MGVLAALETVSKPFFNSVFSIGRARVRPGEFLGGARGLGALPEAAGRLLGDHLGVLEKA